MEACRKIFIEPNGINVPQTPQMRLWYTKGLPSFRVGIPQVYKWVKPIAP